LRETSVLLVFNPSCFVTLFVQFVANGRDVSRTINRAKMIVNSVSAVRPFTSYITARFRSAQKYPRVYTRTSRYCSFINYSL